MDLPITAVIFVRGKVVLFSFMAILEIGFYLAFANDSSVDITQYKLITNYQWSK